MSENKLHIDVNGAGAGSVKSTDGEDVLAALSKAGFYVDTIAIKIEVGSVRAWFGGRLDGVEVALPSEAVELPDKLTK